MRLLRVLNTRTSKSHTKGGGGSVEASAVFTMGGYIMQLQNFSVNDGDGIRTIVFMAGCPLRCAWCANPEGQTRRNAMTHWTETRDILNELRHQAIFFRHSGGGVTFSGGEATAQPTFLKEMVDILYDEGFSLAIETCGYFDFEQMLPILRKMDTVFIDIKHINTAAHAKFTGVGNELILTNICRASAAGLPLVVRIPTIIGVNADDETMQAVFDFFDEHCIQARLEFLPYHRYGEPKYEQLGLALPDSRFATPNQEQLERWTAMAKAHGIEVVSYK